MTTEIPIVESGFQLQKRLKPRPSVRDLDNVLFSNGLGKNETVELSGNISSGKSLLLAQLIAKCILPEVYEGIKIGGLDAGVLLINNDQHIKMYRLKDLMLGILKKSRIRSRDFEAIVKKSLKNLTLIHCYDNSQFFITSHTLDTIFLDNERIGLVCVDSITAFYWQDRERGGAWIIDEYIKNILKVLQKYAFPWDIPVIYTKPVDSTSNVKETITFAKEPTLEKINHRIRLHRDEQTLKFTCSIETPHCAKKEHQYKINLEGIQWTH